MIENRLHWDDHHMLLALVASLRSPDPNTQVGAVIVSRDNQILSTGYNAFPRGIPQCFLNWNREGEPLNTKYPFVVHAEANAILNNNTKLEGSVIFCTLFPCNECAKIIIQAGIKTVIFLNNPYQDTWQIKASMELLSLAGVKVQQHQWQPQISTHLSRLMELIK